MEALANHPSLGSLQKHWLDKGVLSPVRNQGLCNCCWTIVPTVTAAALRKIEKRSKGYEEPLHQLSIQEIIDCTKERYNVYRDKEEDRVKCFPCKMGAGFQFLVDYGVCLESEYPFVLKRGDCKAGQIKTRRLHIKGYERVLGTVDEVFRAIDAQPLAGAIKVHISDIKLKYLGAEIYQQPEIAYGPKTLEESIHYKGDVYGHAVTIVGYGQELHTRYYFIQNSWGTSWGVEGFGKIECSKIYCIRRPVGPVFWSP